jgi:hypothetical protein
VFRFEVADGWGIDVLGKLVEALSRAARWDSGPYPSRRISAVERRTPGERIGGWMSWA